MEDSNFFADIDLNEEKISDLLNDQDEAKGKINKENKNKDGYSSSNNSKKFRTKNKEKSCDSYIFVFLDFLIQSLISYGFYYLCYILKFDFEGAILKIFLVITLLLFIALICFMSQEGFKPKYYQYINCALFFIINIFKIIFDVFLYLMIVSDKNKDGIGYSLFEARAYWKFSICLFYLFLIFYYYFKNDNNDFNFRPYLISSCFCLAICLFLLIFTQKNSDNMFRIINYTGYDFLELFFVIYAIYFENKQPKIFEYLKIKINWRVNRIDFLRFGIVVFAAFFRLALYCTKKCRCCRKTK